MRPDKNKQELAIEGKQIKNHHKYTLILKICDSLIQIH